jgi:hypothetical protein
MVTPVGGSPSIGGMEEYKPTLFDRHGPAAADRIRLAGYVAMVFVLTFGVLALKLGLSLRTLLWSLIAGAVSGSAVYLFAKLVGDGSRALTMGSHTSASGEEYSYQKSLVMQGKVAEALASYESLIVASATAIGPRILAAELYSREAGGALRAAELLRQVQRIPSIPPERDIYVTNRLVDLLIGPLDAPGRALVELRRLIERYPNTAAADHARQALARIKALQ